MPSATMVSTNLSIILTKRNHASRALQTATFAINNSAQLNQNVINVDLDSNLTGNHIIKVLIQTTTRLPPLPALPERDYFKI